MIGEGMNKMSNYEFIECQCNYNQLKTQSEYTEINIIFEYKIRFFVPFCTNCGIKTREDHRRGWFKRSSMDQYMELI